MTATSEVVIAVKADFTDLLAAFDVMIDELGQTRDRLRERLATLEIGDAQK